MVERMLGHSAAHRASPPKPRRGKSGVEPFPVPLEPGEVGLYVGGWASRRQIGMAWLGAGAMVLYDMFSVVTLIVAPEDALLSGPMLAGFLGAGYAFVKLALSACRSTVRAAVLTKDGLFLRLYPFGPFGFGVGTPVTIPIAACRLAGDGASRPKPSGRAEIIHAHVGGDTRYHVAFDKPEVLLPWVGGDGPGVLWGPRGITGVSPPSTTPVPPPPTPVTELATSMTAVEGTALGKYAILLHALQGRPVHMPALEGGAIPDLAGLRAALDPERHVKPSDLRVAQLRLWRRAVTQDGTPYWWNVCSPAAPQWVRPELDGRGPEECHPDLFSAPPPVSAV